MVSSKLWYLMNMDIFKDLSREEYAIIDRDSASLSIRKRETLPFQGTADTYIYFLKRGTIKLVKITAGGRSVALDILKAGTLFGEVNGVLAGHGEDLTAEALEDCFLCQMSKRNFDHLMTVVPCLSKRVTKIIGLRFKRIENRLSELLYSTVEERLARVFLYLAAEFGVCQQEGTVIQVRLTHNDLSELIASTRETVTLTVNSFKSKELVDYVGKRFVLLNSERLQEIAGPQ